MSVAPTPTPMMPNRAAIVAIRAPVFGSVTAPVTVIVEDSTRVVPFGASPLAESVCDPADVVLGMLTVAENDPEDFDVA